VTFSIEVENSRTNPRRVTVCEVDRLVDELVQVVDVVAVVADALAVDELVVVTGEHVVEVNDALIVTVYFPDTLPIAMKSPPVFVVLPASTPWS
jgi:hypothetical protein